MKIDEQEYSKTTFDEVACRYDEIEFFKTSAKHVVDIIKENIDSNNNSDILDVACGTGNVVLECALSLNNSSFDAIDISDGMLNVAKQKAKEKKLDNVFFSNQDITKLNTDKKYDVITCSYALFFLPDSSKILAKLISLLKENGFVLFTSFLDKAFTPSTDILLSLLKKHGSKSANEYNLDKWENLKTQSDIEKLCKLANTTNIKISQHEIRYKMNLDEWWELHNNTGYKGMLMEVSDKNILKLKEEYFNDMSSYIDTNSQVELIADTYFVEVRK